MTNKFPHQQIDSKWREVWKEQRLYKPNLKSEKDKYYALVASPYPSGYGLHVGHMYCFNPVDILARFERMRGKEVILPIGWDSFGLPAENYAIKTGIHPNTTTQEAISNFKWQLDLVGFSTDWETYELAAHWENYYKWTQWIFLQMYKDGLAYRANAPVNWCPSCQTVLANEQVINGKCERCDSLVLQKDMEQWFMKITNYSERLYQDLDEVDWPESTKAAQKNWIGRSEGAEVEFQILPSRKVTEAEGSNDGNTLKVFTTRPDTIYGATFMVIAPEHAMLVEMQDFITNNQDIINYKNQAKLKSQLERESQIEKTGVEVKGIKAINPMTKAEIPIFVADYVLNTYGTGAIMAVPAHDERDFEFATKYGCDIVQVIKRIDAKGNLGCNNPNCNNCKDNCECEVDGCEKLPFLTDDENSRLINSDILNGLTVPEAKKRIIEEFEKLGIGSSKITYRLRDWLISRQRYWGCPIPIVYLNKLNIQDGKFSETSFSYLMGAENITNEDLKELEISFNHKGSVRTCIISNNQIHDYKKLVKEKLSNGFWNEIISEQQIWFCFKDKSGNISEYILNNDNYQEILVKCNEYVGSQNFSNLYDMLLDNEFYAEYFTRELNPVDEKYLPLKLPTDVEFKPTGESPIAYSESYKKLAEELYGIGSRFEFDTLDTFIDSSWYYMRYMSVNDDRKAFDSELCNAWLPTDLYMIGPEHIVLHLMYSRFFTKYFFDKGLINYSEPFYKMRHQGMIQGPDGRKMSKRWGNIVNPSTVCEKYGADTLRVYEMFMGPLEQSKNWSEETVVGVRRYIDRVWSFAEKLESTEIKYKLELPLSHKIRYPRDIDIADIWVSLAEGWQDNNISQENEVDSEYIKNIEGYDENRDILDVKKEKPWLTTFDTKNNIKYVYEVNGEVAGWFGLWRKDENSNYSLGIYIKRKFRNQGIGKNALNYLFNVLKPNNDIVLEVVKNNKAINLYKKFGFVECGEDKYMLKDNLHYLPVIKMVRYVSTPKVKAELQKLIKYVTTNIPELKFNTCVAEFMKFQNLIEQEDMTISIDDFLTYMKLLAPFAPFITDEIYNNLTNIPSSAESVAHSETEEVSIHQTNWPTWDEKLISEEKMVIGVQVNGKLRGELELSVDDDEFSLKEKIMQDMNIAKWLQGAEIKKFIYVKGRIVSIVI